jgi:hypothetical protein
MEPGTTEVVAGLRAEASRRRNASFSHQATRCPLTGWSAAAPCRAWGWGKSKALSIAPCSFRNRRSSACASGCIGTIQVRRTGEEQGPG